MAKDRFVYVTYIRTTPQKLWKALIDKSFHRRYWFGCVLESTWKKGAPWQMISEEAAQKYEKLDGTRHNIDKGVMDEGKVLEIKPMKRLVLSWQNQWKPELKKEGWSRATFDVTKTGDQVKLMITHEINQAKSKLIQAVGGGWPQILSSLKTLLETGKSLQEKK